MELRTRSAIGKEVIFVTDDSFFSTGVLESQVGVGNISAIRWHDFLHCQADKNNVHYVLDIFYHGRLSLEMYMHFKMLHTKRSASRFFILYTDKQQEAILDIIGVDMERIDRRLSLRAMLDISCKKSRHQYRISCGCFGRRVNFTRRELQVVVHIIQGNSENKIAELLGIKPKTVLVYKNKIFNKIGCRSLCQFYFIVHPVKDILIHVSQLSLC
ncbi:LuxR C-terminal-related transcriptional regulator [Pantoea sp. 1.19]|uniref:helix-turn-helix transcriptional regulator n=1 Tax=Pantoea sp. 1.19 TaxID=1925589 RepID=UPI0009F9713E|nr:LuxR C-terminal-related transcriptional regulator [Pantoea sp. 1.19]